jgi:hypothetical protein
MRLKCKVVGVLFLLLAFLAGCGKPPRDTSADPVKGEIQGPTKKGGGGLPRPPD